MPPTQTIFNHELSTSLDSTHAFEGPEKLLEIWFNLTNTESFDLRSIKYESIVKILNLVHCEVLSKISNREMDAYLLSESSLFVFENKIILKTCGRTTLLSCLGLLFETVKQEIGEFVQVQQVFYSRRSFFFPDQQLHVHSNWNEEVSVLDNYFENGKSYIVGHNTNWHLYVAGDLSVPDHDSTLEIIMTKLSLGASKKFYTSRLPGDLAGDADHDLGHESGQDVLNATGLNSLFKHNKGQSPASKEIHDGFAFTPCGFSSNSMSGAGNYYTIHVTPEPGWSYASFETNMNGGDYKEIIDKCINVFEPGQFMVTFLTNSDVHKFECCLEDDYKIHHKEELDVGGYKLFFVEFVRA